MKPAATLQQPIKTYDLINISLLDAFGASAAGLYSMAENYLYTEQAIQQYLQHVNANGYLSITRWIKIPPRDEPKLLATVIHALKELNTGQPNQQIIMIRSWQTSTLMVKNGVISVEEINRLKQFCNERSFDLVYYPGISEQEVNRFNIQQQPYLYQAAIALLGDKSQAFIDDYKFNITPATDDRPYFFHFFKWESLAEILSILRQRRNLFTGKRLFIINSSLTAGDTRQSAADSVAALVVEKQIGHKVRIRISSASSDLFFLSWTGIFVY